MVKRHEGKLKLAPPRHRTPMTSCVMRPCDAGSGSACRICQGDTRHDVIQQRRHPNASDTPTATGDFPGGLGVPAGSEAQWLVRQVAKSAVVLDVGCGGGWTVRKLAALASEGNVIGLDYSAASVAVSRDTNAKEIEAGRVQIERGSVEALPLRDRTFDVVTAVETHYYWPDLPANVREILRVPKPGGTFALIAETYRGGPLRLVYGMVMPLLRAAFLSDAEHRDLLTRAGMTEVATMDLRHGPQAAIAGLHRRFTETVTAR